MPNPYQYTVDQELRFFTELENINLRNERFRSAVTPNLARNVSNLAYSAPRAPKEVLMTAGRALTDNLITPQQADDIVVGTEQKVLRTPMTYKFDSKSSPGSIWDQMFEGIKVGAKWGMAGIQLPADALRIAGGAAVSGAIQGYQAVTNAPAQITQNIMQTGSIAPDPGLFPDRRPPGAEYIGVPELPQTTLVRGAPFTPGSLDADLGTIWRSTELGALFSGADSGNGWFIGEEAKRIQMENQSKLLGTIDGQPIQPGAIALLATTPGTKPYNILSGLTNLAVDVVAPAPPVGAAVRFGTRAASGIDIAPALRAIGLAEAGDIRPLIRSTAGLTNLTTRFVDPKKVASFLDSTMGQAVMQRLAGITDYDEVARLFPKTDINFRQAVVDATEKNIREVLETNLGTSRGVMNVQDFNLSRLGDVKASMLNNGLSRWSGIERLAAGRAGREIAIVTDDPIIATQSVENLKNYLVALRVAPDTRNTLINKLADTLVNNTDNTKVVINEIQQEVIKQLNKQRGLPTEMLEKMFSQFTEFKDQYVLFGQLGADDMPMMFGLGDVRKAKMLGKNAKGEKGMYLIPDGTAGTSAEMRRTALILPDFDRVYRATSQWSWLWETWSRDPAKFGNPNTPLLMLHLVNKGWRKLVTMTGAYALRNLMESSVRASLAPGIKTGPLSPVEWIRTIIHSEGFGKYLGDVEGVPFDEYAEVLTKAEYRDWGDAVDGVLRENIDSALIEKRAATTGVWQIVAKSQEALYPQMLMDNIQLLAEDELFRMVARRMTTDEIIAAIKAGDDEAMIAVRNLQRRYSNIRHYNVGTGKYEKATLEYIDEAGEINEANIRRFIEYYVRPRVAYNTGGTRRPDGSFLLDGDERLMEIIANGDRLGTFNYNGRTVDAFRKAELGPTGELISLDYSDDFKSVIRDIINDDVMGPRMPVKGKARVNVETMGMPARGQVAGDAVDTFGNVFFSTLFGRPDSYLHRSPAWRQYHYNKIAELLDDLAPGEAKVIRDSVLRAKGYNAKQDISKLLKVRPQSPLRQILEAKQMKGQKFLYNNKTLNLNAYLDEVRRQLTNVGFDAARTEQTVETIRLAVTTARSSKKSVVRNLLNETGVYKYGKENLNQNQYLEMLNKRLVDLGFEPQDAANRIEELRDVLNNRPGDLTAVSGQLQTDVLNTVLGSERFGARWVGSKDLWKRITDKANDVTPSTGDLTAEQINQVARIFAAEQTKKAFFDASKQSNFTSVVRMISPFHGAWAEQMKSFTRILTQSDKNLKKGVVLMDNMRSFFYNDPVTGEPYFNYGPTDIALPIIFAMMGGGLGGVAASGLGLGGLGQLGAVAAGGVAGGFAGREVSNKVAEVMPVLRGPAKSLSMAFNVIPGVGPMVQIPANQILNKWAADVKELDTIRQFIMPFGPPEGIAGALTMSWLRKLSEAFTQDPETDTVWAQFKMDSFVALMASGKYDRMNPEDQSRALKKAESIATWLTIAQGVGQLVGPARPGVAMEIPTQFKGYLDVGDVQQMVEDGNITNITLARVFRIFQDEDYDTAPQKMIELFGENTIYLMAGRTTTELTGLQATEEFADFERDNSDFAETHRSVFGWFAPAGSEFDKQAYMNQLASGLRERRTDPFKLVDDVEFIVGSAMYRLLQKELGEDGELTTVDKERLKMYRASLEEYFPGYASRPQITNRTETAINDALAAANDSRISGNPVAEAIKAYQAHRQWAIDVAQQRRVVSGGTPAVSNILSGNANADLRLYLRDIGETVIQEYAEFGRIYDAVFYFEIDEVG